MGFSHDRWDWATPLSCPEIVGCPHKFAIPGSGQLSGEFFPGTFQAPIVVRLHPNPVRRDGMLTLEVLPTQAATLILTVSNEVGQEVRRTEMPVAEGTTTLSVQTDGLQPGVYTLQVSNGRRTDIRQFVVAP